MTERPKVAVLDDYQGVALSYADWGRVSAACDVEVFRGPLRTVDEAAEALADFDAICLMRERMPVPAALIERLPKLKLIVVTGAHNRTLDLAAAAARGITVSCTRNADGQYPTAELAWALILGAARHTAAETLALREGGWQQTVGRTLRGTTLGILGLGRIGQTMARLGQAFGMKTIAWSPNLTADKAEAAGCELVSKDGLFARSDVLTIHMVLSERTRGLVGAADLERLKPDAIVVNTSRGPLIDEAALVAALKARTFGAAALDVFDEEPLPADHPFRSMDNVVATPHLGYVTRETYEIFFADTVEAIEAFLAGVPIRLLKPA